MTLPRALFILLLLTGLGIELGLLPVPWDVPVGSSYLSPSLQNPALLFGTDLFGRSVLYKVLVGLGTAIRVGFTVGICSVLFGLFLGVLSGGLSGRWDDLIWTFAIAAGAIPGLILAMALSTLLQNGTLALIISLSLTSWVGVYRLVRAEVMRTRELGFAFSAQVLGAQRVHIFWKHYLFQCTWIGFSQFGLHVGYAIRSEVILSFLGVGVWKLPSWGVMIEDGRMGLARGVWWEFAAASLAMAGVALFTQLAFESRRGVYNAA